jgi:hypothetical protein
MHALIACLLLYEDYVWVSLGNAMKAKQSKAKLSYLPILETFPWSDSSSSPKLVGVVSDSPSAGRYVSRVPVCLRSA